MRLTSFELPLTIHAINKSYNNYYFHIDSKNVDISCGNYSTFSDINKSSLDSSNNITTMINKALSNAYMPDVKYSIDEFTGKSKFSDSSGRTLHFNKLSDSDDDLDTPLPLKLGWLLGFRAGSYTLPAISEGICAISGPRYIYICINDYTNAGNNNFTAAFSSSTLSPHIIARINY